MNVIVYIGYLFAIRVFFSGVLMSFCHKIKLSNIIHGKITMRTTAFITFAQFFYFLPLPEGSRVLIASVFFSLKGPLGKMTGPTP